MWPPHEANVCTLYCHSQGTSFAAVPMSDRHARRLLPYQARMRFTRHLWNVFRSWITKEEAGQLSSFLSGILNFQLLWSALTIESLSTTFCAKTRCQCTCSPLPPPPSSPL